MKKILLTACLVLIFFGGTISAQNKKYRIEGIIDSSFDGQRAILSLKDDYNKVIRTDTFVIDHGHFIFEGDEYLGGLSAITIEDKYRTRTRPILGLLLEMGTISVSYPDDKPYMHGTPLNDIYTRYENTLESYRSEISKLGIEWITPTGIAIPPGSELSRLFYEQGEYMLDFMKQNYSNPLGKAMFKDLSVKMSDRALLNIPIHMYTGLTEKRIDEIFDFVDAETRAFPPFISYMERLNELKTPSPLIGKQLDNFTLSTPSGAAKQLSDYIGKKDYVFLEFWASWCGPCIGSIPELKEIYAEHSDKLEIVSISLDTNQKSWTDAMKAQNMPWPQLADLKAFDSDIAKWLGIKGIPFGVLVDKDGVIVDLSSAAGLKFFMQNK